MKNKQFPITLNQKELEVIKRAAECSRRSISSYLVWAGLYLSNKQEALS